MAVLFCQDPRVEDDDDAFVLLRANEATDTLAEFQNRLRERILGEWIPAAAFDFLEPCFDCLLYTSDAADE